MLFGKEICALYLYLYFCVFGHNTLQGRLCSQACHWFHSQLCTEALPHKFLDNYDDNHVLAMLSVLWK